MCIDSTISPDEVHVLAIDIYKHYQYYFYVFIISPLSRIQAKVRKTALY